MILRRWHKFDIPSGKKIGVIKSNLTMPHNISLINDKFHILDSLNGNLLTNNFTVQGTFPGFSRGLDFNGKYYFIGQVEIDNLVNKEI